MDAERTPVVVGADQWVGREADPAAALSPLDTLERVARGAVTDAEVLANTLVYDRDGGPVRGIVIGPQSDGARFIGNTPEDRALLEGFVALERVGTAGCVRSEGGHHIFEPR